MFKKIIKTYLLLGVLLCSLTSVGCKHTEPTPEETIIEIYCDYFNSLFGYKRIRKKDVKIRYYLGQYSDAKVLRTIEKLASTKIEELKKLNGTKI